MALIICPECEREISDSAEVCPHCGYPLKARENLPEVEPEPVLGEDAPQSVIGISENPEPQKKVKTPVIIVSVIAVIAVALIAVFAIQNSNAKKARNDYIDNLELIRYAMLQGGADAEELCELTRKVWYDTIYEDYRAETYAYTQSDYVFHDDFNTSLTLLYSDSDTLATIELINSNRAVVDELMKQLQNPPDDMKICYDTINSLYEVYRNLTGLAISPTGSLQTYTESLSFYSSDFMTYYDKLSVQIPEKS